MAPSDGPIVTAAGASQGAEVTAALEPTRGRRGRSRRFYSSLVVIVASVIVVIAVVVDVETHIAKPSPTPITASDGTVTRTLPWEPGLGDMGGPSQVYPTINVTSSFAKNGSVGASMFNMSVLPWINNEGTDGYFEWFVVQVSGAVLTSVNPSTVSFGMNDFDSGTTDLTANVILAAGLNDINVSSLSEAYASQHSNTGFIGLGALSLQVAILNESTARATSSQHLFHFSAGLYLLAQVPPQNQSIGDTYDISATLGGMSEPVFCLLAVQMPPL
jgi:hypothetical protein